MSQQDNERKINIKLKEIHVEQSRDKIVGECWDCQEPINGLYARTWRYLSTFRCYECYSEKGFEGISTDLSRKDLKKMKGGLIKIDFSLMKKDFDKYGNK